MESTEDAKKHGDKLESLVERTSGRSPPEAPNNDGDDDAADLQDDDDEDVQNDDVESRRDV
jgi:hypothetical protein